MQLTNDFEVAVPVETAWTVLTDIERIAPCLPGAQLREVQGDEYRGAVKVKVGPITTSYEGAIRFSELDEGGLRAVMKAEGRETRGQGNVSAIITATLVPKGEGTKVTVVTDLTISGKGAQFGRGVLADVSAKLLDQFVTNLETTVLIPGAGTAQVERASFATNTEGDVEETSTMSAELSDAKGLSTPSLNGDPAGEQRLGAGASAVRPIDAAPSEPVDLVDLARGSVLKRIVKPAVIAGAIVFVLVAKRRRQR